MKPIGPLGLWSNATVRRAPRVLTLGVIVLLTGLTSAQSRAPAAQSLSRLDRYAAGQFDEVAAELAGLTDFQQLFDDLKGHSEAWLEAGGPADRHRRQLAAATFALEAARVAAWREWKLIQESPPQTSPLPTIYWKPAPLLIEWGCERLRNNDPPVAVERVWHLAALAVAQRGEDPQFLIGMTQIVAAPGEPTELPPLPTPRRYAPEVLNSQKEISHLLHARKRFPEEPRFLLAEGLARERVVPNEAALAYADLVKHPDVGAEAELRLGALLLRQNRLPEAMKSLDRVERRTRDPYLVHLTRFFRGQIHVRQQREREAIEAFRGALAARPGAQSASVMLAELLFKDGRRSEAQRVMADALAANPAGGDPNLEYAHGDDRFWPELLIRLRREITR